jgi:hypothetical protein
VRGERGLGEVLGGGVHLKIVFATSKKEEGGGVGFHVMLLHTERRRQKGRGVRDRTALACLFVLSNAVDLASSAPCSIGQSIFITARQAVGLRSPTSRGRSWNPLMIPH